MAENLETENSERTLLSELKDLSVKFKNDIIHFSLDYDELVEIFHTYMLELVNYSPLNLYNNPLTRFIRLHLGDEIPGCFLEEFKYYEDDESFKNEMANLSNYYNEVIDGGYGISDLEFEKLYQLSFVDLKNSSKYIRYLLSQLMEGGNKTNSGIYINLVTRFINDLIDTNDLDVKFCVGNFDKDDDIYADSVCKKGFYFVTFDRSHLVPEKIFFNLEDIFHEMWHTVQDDEEYNDPNVIRLIKMDNFISRVLGAAYYDENYEIISYEVDANLHAVMMLTNLLKDISPETYKVNKERLNERVEAYSEMLYSRKRFFGGVEYDIDVLFDRALSQSGKSSEDVLGDSQEGKKYLKEIKV